MDNSPNLSLPFILPAQAQKHVTHNEALRMLDGVIQLSLIRLDETAPPPSPSEGDCYALSGSPTAEWSLHPNELACFQDGAWAFVSPQLGWRAWDQANQQLVVWDGTVWTNASPVPATLSNLDGAGILSSPDQVNRLSVKSDAILFSHDDVTPGTGDHQTILNKAAPGNTASFLFQTGYSGRAEFGLTGDDDWHVKVSPDGLSWTEALMVDKDTGTVRFPQGIMDPNSNSLVQQFIPLPDVGDAKSSIWRLDPTRDPLPRAATIAGVASDTITLTTSVAAEFFSPQMTGVVCLQIENTSKSPREKAWIKARPAANQLQFTDPVDISGWLSGEALQLGQSVGVFSDQYAILDVSPMMTAQFGAEFRQKGVWVYKSFAKGTSASAGIRTTPDGASGSVAALVDSLDDGTSRQNQGIIPCFAASPISHSHLIYLRETGSAGDISICGVTLGGLYV